MIHYNKKILLCFCLSLLIFSACSNENISEEYNEEETIVIEFLNNIYSSNEDDVRQYSSFMDALEQNESLNSSGIVEFKDLPEFNKYISYLKNKYNISDELMKKLYSNNKADYYIKKSYDENIFYLPDDIQISYNKSLKTYDFQLTIDNKSVKGSLRLENKSIVWYELNF